LLKYLEKHNNSIFLKGFLGILLAIGGAFMGNPDAVNEGIKAGAEAGIKSVEIILELKVFFNVLLLV
jgi:hypothetical protein